MRKRMLLLLFRDPRPENAEGCVPIFRCLAGIERGQLYGGGCQRLHRRDGEFLGQTLENMLGGSILDQRFDFKKWSGASLFRLVREPVRNFKESEDLARLWIRGTPLDEAVPDVPDARAKAFLAREARHHGVGELEFDLAVERIHQVVFGGEVGEERTLGHARSAGDDRGRGPETALGEYPGQI